MTVNFEYPAHMRNRNKKEQAQSRIRHGQLGFTSLCWEIKGEKRGRQKSAFKGSIFRDKLLREKKKQEKNR